VLSLPPRVAAEDLFKRLYPAGKADDLFKTRLEHMRQWLASEPTSGREEFLAGVDDSRVLAQVDLPQEVREVLREMLTQMLAARKR
jgi:hypothetical protein